MILRCPDCKTVHIVTGSESIDEMCSNNHCLGWMRPLTDQLEISVAIEAARLAQEQTAGGVHA